MRCVIFGGTTEGRLLATALADRGVDVVVSVASAIGREVQEAYPGVRVTCGALQADDMANLLVDADLCIDATHPYALEATRTIKEAAGMQSVPLVRLVRPESTYPARARVVPDVAAAVDSLRDVTGPILVTTGVKELATFATLGVERLYPRIIPTKDGIALCERLGIPRKNIIAMQGPFSCELNKAIIRQFSITTLVTKDGGEIGGFQEKVRAVKECDIRLVIIARVPEEGLSFEQVLDVCEGLLP